MADDPRAQLLALKEAQGMSEEVYQAALRLLPGPAGEAATEPEPAEQLQEWPGIGARVQFLPMMWGLRFYSVAEPHLLPACQASYACGRTDSWPQAASPEHVPAAFAAWPCQLQWQ